jgi:hypothetical protein
MRIRHQILPLLAEMSIVFTPYPFGARLLGVGSTASVAELRWQGLFQVREDEPTPRVGAGRHRTPSSAPAKPPAVKCLLSKTFRRL